MARSLAPGGGTASPYARRLAYVPFRNLASIGPLASDRPSPARSPPLHLQPVLPSKGLGRHPGLHPSHAGPDAQPLTYAQHSPDAAAPIIRALTDLLPSLSHRRTRYKSVDR